MNSMKHTAPELTQVYADEHNGEPSKDYTRKEGRLLTATSSFPTKALFGEACFGTEDSRSVMTAIARGLANFADGLEANDLAFDSLNLITSFRESINDAQVKTADRLYNGYVDNLTKAQIRIAIVNGVVNTLARGVLKIVGTVLATVAKALSAVTFIGGMVLHTIGVGISKVLTPVGQYISAALKNKCVRRVLFALFIAGLIALTLFTCGLGATAIAIPGAAAFFSANLTAVLIGAGVIGTVGFFGHQHVKLHNKVVDLSIQLQKAQRNTGTTQAFQPDVQPLVKDNVIELAFRKENEV